MSTKKIPEGAGEHFRGPTNPTQPASQNSSATPPLVGAQASLSEVGRLCWLRVQECPRCADEHVLTVRIWRGDELSTPIERSCPATGLGLRIYAAGGDLP